MASKPQTKTARERDENTIRHDQEIIRGNIVARTERDKRLAESAAPLATKKELGTASEDDLELLHQVAEERGQIARDNADAETALRTLDQELSDLRAANEEAQIAEALAEDERRWVETVVPAGREVAVAAREFGGKWTELAEAIGDYCKRTPYLPFDFRSVGPDGKPDGREGGNVALNNPTFVRRRAQAAIVQLMVDAGIVRGTPSNGEVDVLDALESYRRFALDYAERYGGQIKPASGRE